MAKKNDNAATFLIILFFIAVLIFIIFTPLVLIVLFLSNRAKYFTLKASVKGDISDFWLDASEQTNFASLVTRLGNAVREIEEAESRGDHENVSRNKDGCFSKRSRLGKELCSIIERNRQIIEEFSDEYLRYKSLPHNRWKSFKNSFIVYRSAFTGLIFWILAVLFEANLYPEGYLDGIIRFFKFPINLVNGQLYTGEFKYMVVITTITLAVAGIQALISRKKPGKLSPEPPEVTEDNYNSYTRGKETQRIAAHSFKQNNHNENQIKTFGELSYAEGRTLINNLSCIMKADGNVSDEEKIKLLQLCKACGINEEDLFQILSDDSEYEFVIPKDIPTRIIHLFYAVMMMMADGDINYDEFKCCEEIASKLGFYQQGLVSYIVKTLEKQANGTLSDDQVIERMYELELSLTENKNHQTIERKESPSYSLTITKNKNKNFKGAVSLKKLGAALKMSSKELKNCIATQKPVKQDLPKEKAEQYKNAIESKVGLICELNENHKELDNPLNNPQPEMIATETAPVKNPLLKHPQPSVPQTEEKALDRIYLRKKKTATFLAIFLGGLGIHKFYCGKIWMGILYLLFFWTGIPAVVSLIEGIMFFSQTDDESFSRKYVAN